MPIYLSSRNRCLTAVGHQAIIRGLADDGGLYTPYPLRPFLHPEELTGLSYQETAALILRHFFDDFSEQDLHSCISGAYDDKFDTPEIAPLTALSDCSLLELWHGPTSAFKDIALTILPRLMTAACRMDSCSDTISILTATSGDTGKAALSGFADVPGTAITVFYPEVGVSAVQKQQMVTSRGRNVSVIAVRGNFDDCQRMVKEASCSPQLLDGLTGVRVSSANSINAGRLVPQIVYYCTAYAQLVRSGRISCGDPVNFAVPTGNFGDILAGYLAKAAGLPVGRLICASNTNNVLADFLKTGTYNARRPFTPTSSPSMDILISSNLERLLCIASGYDTGLTAALMKDLSETGQFTAPATLMETIRRDFTGLWTDERTCADTIRTLWHEEHALIDPHTAIALAALRRYRQETADSTPAVVLSTASPYKFCRSVYRAVSGSDAADEFAAMDLLHDMTGVPVPRNLAALRTESVRFTETIRPEDGMARIRARLEEINHAAD